MQGNTFKLTGFIGLSVIVHGLLLMAYRQHDLPLDYPRMGKQLLSVTLVTDNKTEIDSKTDAKIEKNKPEHVRVKNVISIHAPSQITSIPLKPEQAVTTTGTETSEKRIDNVKSNALNRTILSEVEIQPVSVLKKDVLQNAQQNYLLGEVHNRLSQYMSYPAHARRRGWEGSVMIGFSVDKQGFLRDIHLTRTSGYTLLDNAALTAIKKVSYIPVDQWGDIFQPVALQLPVVYRLTNS